MRSSLIVFLFFTHWALAQEALKDRLAALEEERKITLLNWRKTNMPEFKLPNDEYVKVYKETWEKYAQEELKLFDDRCKESPADCLTPAQKAQRQTEIRVAIGFMEAKNAWAKDPKGPPPTEQQVRTDLAGGDGSVEKNPNDGNRQPAADLDQELKEGLEKLRAASTAAIKAQKENNPDWGMPPMSQQVLDFFLNNVTSKFEQELALLKQLCEKYPKNEKVCLSDDQISARGDELESEKCFVNRIFKREGKTKKSERETFNQHKEQWAELKAPRDCKALLEFDEKASGPQVVVKPHQEKKDPDENEDEKNPRNYDANTCEWVTDLPKKIVSGPGCSPKQRSRICTGYVVCHQKQPREGRFVRMSTCRPEYCDDAVRCTKDPGYFSRKPKSESKMFVTKPLKDILKGATGI